MITLIAWQRWIKVQAADEMRKLRFFKTVLLLFILSLVINSCVFDPGIPITKKSNVPDPALKGKIQYSYNGSDYYDIADTAWTSELIFLRSSVPTLGNITVSVDGQLQTLIPDNHSSGLLLSTGQFSPGPHALHVTETVPAGTGSLADHYARERMDYSFDYVLFVQADFKPQFRAIEVKDGRVSISWVPYTGGAFVDYWLKIGNDQTTEFRNVRFTDQHHSTYIDSSFVGGHATYTLTVGTTGLVEQSDPYVLTDNYKTKAELTSLSATHYQLAWSGSDVAANIASYDVSLFPLSGFTVQTTTPQADFYSSFPFGQDLAYTVLAKSADGNQYETAGYVATGTKIPYYTQVLHDPIEPYLYLYRQESTFGNDPTQHYPEGIFKLNDQTFAVIDSVISPLGQPSRARLVISPDRQYFYKLTQSTVVRLNPTDFSVISSDSIKTLSSGQFIMNGYGSPDEVFGITNNNFLMGYFYTKDSYYGAVIDLTARKVLSIQGNIRVSSISGDGKYLILDNTLSVYNGNSYSQVANLVSSTVAGAYFLNDDPSTAIIVATGNKVVVYDCAAQTQAASYTVSTFSFGNHFDQYGKKLQVVQENVQFTVFDLATHGITPLDTRDFVVLEGNSLFRTSDNLHSGYALKRF